MSKDGKTVAPVESAPRSITIDVFANFAQFVYDDENPEDPVGPAPNGVPNTDAYMFGWQVGRQGELHKDCLPTARADHLQLHR